MLTRLEDYTAAEIPQNHIEPILYAIFDVADEILPIEPERLSMWDFGIETNIGRIIFQLLQRLSESERFEIMKNIVKQGKSLSTIVREIAIFGQFLGKHGDDSAADSNPPISEPHLTELESLTSKRILKESKKTSLLNTPKLGTVLLMWQKWQASGECNQFIEKHLKDENFILLLFDSLTGETFSHGLGWSGLGDHVERKGYGLDFKALSNIVEPKEIYPFIKEVLGRPDLSKRLRWAMTQFIKKVENPESDDDD